MSAENGQASSLKLDVHVKLKEKPTNSVLGHATVVINDAFAIRGLTIQSGQNGMFINMPRRMDSNGEWYDIVVPKSKEAYAVLSDAVLKAYHAELEKAAPEQETGASRPHSPKKTRNDPQR